MEYRYPHCSPWKTPKKRRQMFAEGLQPLESTHFRIRESVKVKEQPHKELLQIPHPFCDTQVGKEIEDLEQRRGVNPGGKMREGREGFYLSPS